MQQFSDVIKFTASFCDSKPGWKDLHITGFFENVDFSILIV